MADIDLPPVHEMSASEYQRYALTLYTESEWQAWIEREAADRGYATYHTHDSRRSDPGFPDLVCVHPNLGVLYLEVKKETGSLSKEQRYWIELLIAAGERAYVVKPRHVDAVIALLDGQVLDRNRHLYPVIVDN